MGEGGEGGVWWWWGVTGFTGVNDEGCVTAAHVWAKRKEGRLRRPHSETDEH